jgi:hypothetical protein
MPVLVILATGGPSTIGFWIEVAIWLFVAFTFMCLPYYFIAVIPLALVGALARRLIPKYADALEIWTLCLAWLAAGVYSFVIHASLDGSAVRLPTSNTNLGALLVVVGGLAAMAALIFVSDRMPPRSAPHRHQSQPVQTLPEPPTEPVDEFWSPQPIIAWRAWRWNGTCLQGVRAAWTTAQFDAACDLCKECPGWVHACGVYAVSRPGDALTVFGGTADVVGRVELSGLVIEHEVGYRASHARILDLWTTSATIAEMLRARYPEVNVHNGQPPAGDGNGWVF